MENRKRATQAVILAGGLGVRLKPLTELCPKPLISVRGRPFVAYLLERLQQQEFKEVVFLLGYQAEAFQKTLGDGSQFKMKFVFVETPTQWETGARLHHARRFLDDYFFLLYGDNYWPFEFSTLWENYLKTGRKAQVVVYRNDDGYSRSNMSLATDGAVKAYDKSRTTANLEFVDVGFIILQKTLVDQIPDEESTSLEAFLYPRLAEENQLQGFPTRLRYHSVSTLKRLSAIERHLCGPKYIFLDRDGVLNKKMPKGKYVTDWSEWEWEKGALEALRILNTNDYRVIIITNQAGIAIGSLSQPQLDVIHSKMLEQIKASGGEIEQIYYCPHHWDDECDCRKPKPGMLLQAHREFLLDITNTPFIGDSSTDREAAENIGCPFHHVDDTVSLLDIVTGSLRLSAGQPLKGEGWGGTA